MTAVTSPILVAFDKTEPAHAVLEEAVELARRCGTMLVLIRTVPLATTYAPSALVAASQVTAHEEAAERDLRALIDQIPPELVGEAIVRLGTPWEAICQVATDLHASHVVIGFGATSLRVVSSAPCPVVVVRDRAAA